MEMNNQIVLGMCMTWRHDFGLEITEEEKKTSFGSGMTSRERESLYRDMLQLYHHHIQGIVEERDKLKEALETSQVNQRHAEDALNYHLNRGTIY